MNADLETFMANMDRKELEEIQGLLEEDFLRVRFIDLRPIRNLGDDFDAIDEFVEWSQNLIKDNVVRILNPDLALPPWGFKLSLDYCMEQLYKRGYIEKEQISDLDAWKWTANIHNRLGRALQYPPLQTVRMVLLFLWLFVPAGGLPKEGKPQFMEPYDELLERIVQDRAKHLRIEKPEWEVIFVHKQHKNPGDLEQLYTIGINCEVKDPWQYENGMGQVLKDGWEPFQIVNNGAWYRRQK